jgi:hypothetical protein
MPQEKIQERKNVAPPCRTACQGTDSGGETAPFRDGATPFTPQNCTKAEGNCQRRCCPPSTKRVLCAWRQVMNTIRQIVHIPADRRLRLDLTLPEDIPEGQAEMTMIFSPHSMPKTFFQPATGKSLRDYPACGMWADREDMSNPVEWIRKQRDSSRYDY